MSEADRMKFIAHIKTYLDHSLFESGPWLEHHINMHVQLFESARANEPALSLNEYLENTKKPNLNVKSRRR